MTQLLASYRDDRIDYGYFTAFSRVIQNLQLFEAIIEREVGLSKGGSQSRNLSTLRSSLPNTWETTPGYASST